MSVDLHFFHFAFWFFVPLLLSMSPFPLPSGSALYFASSSCVSLSEFRWRGCDVLWCELLSNVVWLYPSVSLTLLNFLSLMPHLLFLIVSFFITYFHLQIFSSLHETVDFSPLHLTFFLFQREHPKFNNLTFSFFSFSIFYSPPVSLSGRKHVNNRLHRFARG